MTEDRSKLAALIAKAWSDEAFLARLRKDPKAAMNEMGVTVPAGVAVEVLEATASKAYLVTPPRPDGDELSEAALDSLSAGYSNLKPSCF